MNDLNSTQLNSPSWMFFVRINFAISMGAMFCRDCPVADSDDDPGLSCDGHALSRRLDLYLCKDRPR